jgi:hypothetical protein
MTCKICVNIEKIIAKGWFDIDYEGTCDTCGNNINFEHLTVKYKEDVILRKKRFHVFETKINVVCLSCGVSAYGIKLYCEGWESFCLSLFERAFVEIENDN